MYAFLVTLSSLFLTHTQICATFKGMDTDLVGAIRLEPREQFDPAILGKSPSERAGGEMVLVYSYEAIVEAVATNSRWSEDSYSEALEYVEYNTIRGIEYMGDRRPLVVYREFDLEENEP